MARSKSLPHLRIVLKPGGKTRRAFSAYYDKSGTMTNQIIANRCQGLFSRNRRRGSPLPNGDLCEMSLAPLRGGVLRWVPGRIPLALHAPGKAADGIGANPSTALSRKPATERSGVESYPGPSATSCEAL